jgi:tetratricopeptide (TPR) repeat protein
MSTSKLYTKNQTLWFRAAHLVVVSIIKQKLPIVESQNQHIEKHLYWRLAYNLFSAEEYFEAMKIFDELNANEFEGFDSKTVDKSFMNQIAGKCCIKLFLITQYHYHLENAYNYYQNAINNIAANLYAMFRVPALLLDFGKVLEYYGALEAAVDVYKRILNKFPNFRGYFDAMYRSAIVGLHSSKLMTNKLNQEDTINKCIDIFQFLLEALPSSIIDVNSV